jgi:uncharacterized membrane protein YpjA
MSTCVAALARVGDVLQRFKTDWRMLGPLMLLNLWGLVFGYYYYADVGQFDLHHLTCGPGANAYCTPWWTWPLVADSPNAVLLFMVAALAYKVSAWRNRWLDAFAFALNVYVGCWTTFLFLGYPSTLGTFDWAALLHPAPGAQPNANPLLFVAHMGMPLQAFVLARDLRKDRWAWADASVVLAALAVFVYVDYWGPHLHPAPFLHQNGVSDDWVHWARDRLLHAIAPWIMVGAAIAWLLVVRPGRPAQPAGDSMESKGPLPPIP